MHLISVLLVILGFASATIEPPPKSADLLHQPAESMKISTEARLDNSSKGESSAVQTRAQARRQRSARIDFTMPYYRFGKFPARIKD